MTDVAAKITSGSRSVSARLLRRDHASGVRHMTTRPEDPSHRIAERFDELVRRTPGGPPWSHGDEVVWHVVSTRCEIDAKLVRFLDRVG